MTKRLKDTHTFDIELQKAPAVLGPDFVGNGGQTP